MKKIVMLLALSTFLVDLAFAQVENKTLVKTLDPGASNAIALDFEFPSKGEEWPESTVRILLEINLKSANTSVLQQLVKIGRYTIVGEQKEGKFVIGIPGLKKDLNYKGQKLEESVQVHLLVPAGAVVNNNSGSTVQIESTLAKKLAAQGLATKGKPFFKPIECEVKLIGNDAAASMSLSDIVIDGVTLQELLKKAE